MTASQKTFLILDGNALLHRAWHAIPPLTTEDGRVVNAVYGFAMVIEKMRTEFHPDYIAVAWDLPGGTFRHEAYGAYKAQREKKAQELYDQIPIIQELLKPYGIPSLSMKGYEGDDILGTVSAMNEKQGVKTLVVTGDLDALQLVTEQTEVIFFVKGLSQTKKYDIEAVKERYGLLPSQLIDYKTLLGDTSDNLPGIPGIGEKTALILLQKFGTVEGIFSAIQRGDVEEKFAKKFLGQEKQAEIMKRLVTIVRDLSLSNFAIEDAKMQDVDVESLLPILRDLEFKTLLKKYDGHEGIKKIENSPEKRSGKKNASLPFAELSQFAHDRVGVFLIAKTQDLFGAMVQSIALTDGRFIFTKENPSKEDLEKIVEFLARTASIVGHDLKEMFHVLDRSRIEIDHLLEVPCFDTLVASYLLASGDREFAYLDIVRASLGVTVEVTDYAGDMIGTLLPLANALKSRLQDDRMLELAQTIEMPLIAVLFRMERNGFAVDIAQLRALASKFDERLQELTKMIYTEAGREFNINSPSQLADILFVDLAISTKGIKKTKTGFSTAASELEKIADSHPIVEKISEYRELAKLKGTYADALPLLVDGQGRIHARFNQCIAATGRLSSADPNLQNIPIRSELGREIRKAFIAKEDYVLVAADYSQIEIRLAASIAHDQSFIRAFQDGADIHKRTAAEMWNIGEDKVTKEQRYAAKAINFGILYGIGPRALARSAGVKFEEAKEFIDRYFLAHPEIQDYIDAMKLQAHESGYVASLFGRRRYLPEIHSGVPQLVNAAERMATNMPVQGSQADIIKKAMIDIDAWIRKEGLDTKMIAQVHDELVFEASKKDANRLAEGVSKRMASVIQLDVPLIVDVSTNRSWGEMK